MAHLGEDPAYRLVGTDALQAWMQTKADEVMDLLDGTHFDIPGPVRTIECRIAPTHTGGIYYTGPSEDFTRPGRMWWSVPKGVETFGTWAEPEHGLPRGRPRPPPPGRSDDLPCRACSTGGAGCSAG